MKVADKMNRCRTRCIVIVTLMDLLTTTRIPDEATKNYAAYVDGLLTVDGLLKGIADIRTRDGEKTVMPPSLIE